MLGQPELAPLNLEEQQFLFEFLLESWTSPLIFKDEPSCSGDKWLAPQKILRVKHSLSTSRSLNELNDGLIFEFPEFCSLVPDVCNNICSVAKKPTPFLLEMFKMEQNTRASLRQSCFFFTQACCLDNITCAAFWIWLCFLKHYIKSQCIIIKHRNVTVGYWTIRLFTVQSLSFCSECFFT